MKGSYVMVPEPLIGADMIFVPETTFLIGYKKWDGTFLFFRRSNRFKNKMGRMRNCGWTNNPLKAEKYYYQQACDTAMKIRRNSSGRKIKNIWIVTDPNGIAVLIPPLPDGIDYDKWDSKWNGKLPAPSVASGHFWPIEDKTF